MKRQIEVKFVFVGKYMTPTFRAQQPKSVLVILKDWVELSSWSRGRPVGVWALGLFVQLEPI